MTGPVPPRPVPAPPLSGGPVPPAGPRPPVPGPVGPPAGDVPPGVARALARLDELDGTATPQHVEVFDGVHRLLQDALATLDEV